MRQKPPTCGVLAEGANANMVLYSGKTPKGREAQAGEEGDPKLARDWVRSGSS